MTPVISEDVRQTLRQFIVENFLFGRETLFTDEESLIERGLIDSTGILELIAFLESKYSFKVLEDEMVPDNLDSIARLGDFIRRKTESPA
jgi:acyl carrier protein